MSDTAGTLQTTALHARHGASGARLVAYAGWEMPLEFSSITEEHLAVRRSVGLFDVSHMGEIEIAGKNALALVQRISCNDASALAVGQAQYAGLLTPEGTFIDDMLVYRMAPIHFLLVVNAANAARAYAWIAEQAAAVGDAAVVDSSSRYALLALQGPAAREVLQEVATIDVGEIQPFHYGYGEVAGGRATIARTGYTGEDGFEIFVPPNVAERVWLALLESGKGAGIRPCGLGARDTLRLEAGMRLHGSDIDETTTVLEAGLGGIVAWDKGDFIGRARLAEQKAQGVARRLVGFEMLEPGIARAGFSVVQDGREVGRVTSGTRTPHLQKAVGLAYVPTALAAPDAELTIDVRSRELRAKVVRLPFYRRGRAA
jgi:aminomethyltransferase